MYRITVFTPTYNRAYTLPRLYESLKAQTFHDFEWVIVDDGSTDNTTEVVDGFLRESPFFEIKYRKTENGGKHRAINRGMDMVSGELTYLVDSDDWLPTEALALIDSVERSIPSDEKGTFAGVCGLRCHQSGEIVGKTFDGDYIDITTLDRGKYNITGDRAEVFYTSILRAYPFPEIDGERFATESLVWDRIAYDGYKLRFFNKNIYLCEYLEDGLTNQGLRLYAKNPIQWAMSISQDRKFGKTKGTALSIQYYKYYLHEKNRFTSTQMADLLELSVTRFCVYVLFQRICDVIRGALGKNKIMDELRE